MPSDTQDSPDRREPAVGRGPRAQRRNRSAARGPVSSIRKGGRAAVPGKLFAVSWHQVGRRASEQVFLRVPERRDHRLGQGGRGGGTEPPPSGFRGHHQGVGVAVAIGCPLTAMSPSLELGNLVWGKGLGRRQQGKDRVMTAPLTARLGPQADDLVRDIRGT